MSTLPLSQAYLDFVDKLHDQDLSEYGLIQAAKRFPPFDEIILKELVAYSDQIGQREPGRSVAILDVISKIVHFQRCGLRLRSIVDWHVGFAYNRWAQPQKAISVIRQARRGFVRLNDIGWVAASDWQLNALPWTKPDFPQTAKLLEHAVHNLAMEGFAEFALHCRLTLAYAQILSKEFKKASENLNTCESFFSEQGDSVNQALCWLNTASLLRRQNRFDVALEYLKKTLGVFAKARLPINMAKTYQHIAFCYFLSAANYKKAEHYLIKASKIFMDHDLGLSHAECLSGLAQINIVSGNLLKASDQLEQARTLFVENKIMGLSADNYNDSGQLELLKGNPLQSIRYFKSAETLNNRVHNRLNAATALANQGDAYISLGRFQDALQCLELAQRRFQKLGNNSRLAGCEIYLAKVWTALHQYETAHKHLNKAEQLFSQTGQHALFAWVHNQRARIFFLEGKYNQATEPLKNVLAIAEKYGTAPQMALAQRQLGEILSLTKQPTAALQYLQNAETTFNQMGMKIERAITLISIGFNQLEERNIQIAESAFRQSIEISDGIFPDVESRAYAALAMLAQDRNDDEAALQGYRKSIEAGLKLRGGFWQPALAGSYLEKSDYPVAKAVNLAIRLEAHEDAFVFIDSSKAQSLARQIASSLFLGRNTSAKLNKLRSEVQILQRQLRTTFESGAIFQLAKIQEIQSRLIDCAKEYDEKLGQIERQQHGTSPVSITQLSLFDLENFRIFANRLLDRPWMALDYYLTDNKLFGVMITPDDCKTWEISTSAREKNAIDACIVAHQNRRSPSQNHLKILGDLLIPVAAQKCLSPELYLLLVPHQTLHTIPWAALQGTEFNGALVENSIPLIVPSIEILQLLAQHVDQGSKPNRKVGLLLGLSHFKESRPALPLVRTEVETIYEQATAESVSLLDQQSTWNNLKGLCTDKGLARFSFFHIASHIVQDSKTGHLTNIALYDNEILLDQLHDLAPLPALITLSACSGIRGLVYAEDEHISLATTCLAAGAKAVVGSLWPVLDAAAANMMCDFYQNYFSGSSPAEALALAQRKAIENEKELQSWASFNCIGTL